MHTQKPINGQIHAVTCYISTVHYWHLQCSRYRTEWDERNAVWYSVKKAYTVRSISVVLVRSIHTYVHTLIVFNLKQVKSAQPINYADANSCWLSLCPASGVCLRGDYICCSCCFMWCAMVFLHVDNNISFIFRQNYSPCWFENNESLHGSNMVASPQATATTKQLFGN